MKPLNIPITCAVCAVAILLLVGCDSTTDVDYVYQPSLFVAPLNAKAIGNRQLSMKLLIQSPDKNCWELDKVYFSTDTDSVAKIKFVQAAVSIKHPVTKPCTTGTGYDTLYSDQTLTFDKAGTYTLRFQQYDSRGNFLNRSYQFDVTD